MVTTEHKKGLACLEIIDHKDWLITSSHDKHVRIYDLKNLKCLKTILTNHDNISWMKLIPGTTKLITASKDRTAKVWNLETGYIENVLVGH